MKLIMKVRFRISKLEIKSVPLPYKQSLTDNELPQPNEDNETPEVNQEIPETIEEVPESPIENEIEPDEVNEPIVPKPEDEETYEAENEEDIDEDHDSNEIDDLDGDYKVVW